MQDLGGISVGVQKFSIRAKIALGFLVIVFILFVNILLFWYVSEVTYVNIDIQNQITSIVIEVKEVVDDRALFIQTGNRVYSNHINEKASTMKKTIVELQRNKISSHTIIEQLEDIDENISIFQKNFDELTILESQKNALQDKYANSSKKLLDKMVSFKNEMEMKKALDSRMILLLNDMTKTQELIMAYLLNDDSTIHSNWNAKALKDSIDGIIKKGVILNNFDNKQARLEGYRLISLSKSFKDILVKYYGFIEEQQTLLKNMNLKTDQIVKICDDNVKLINQTMKKDIEDLRYKLIIFFLVSVISGGAIVYILSTGIIHRMKKLILATKQIAQSDYEIEVKTSKSYTDELDVLAMSMHNMAASLSASEMKLKDYNKNLEETVKQRTEDLLDAKEKLQEINSLLEAEKEQLKVISITDSLTQLFNRGYIMSRLFEQIGRAKRYNEAFCIILLDIDNFKGVNDRYGHVVGDLVLRETASLMVNCVRETDIIGRYGGEEFLIILPKTELEECFKVAERIRMEVGLYIYEDYNMSVTISGGACAHQGENSTELIKRVDELLYKAKKSGKNCVKY